MAGLDPATQQARVTAPKTLLETTYLAAQTRRGWVAASSPAMTDWKELR
jgi:hypothetical protein